MKQFRGFRYLLSFQGKTAYIFRTDSLIRTPNYAMRKLGEHIGESLLMEINNISVLKDGEVRYTYHNNPINYFSTKKQTTKFTSAKIKKNALSKMFKPPL